MKIGPFERKINNNNVLFLYNNKVEGGGGSEHGDLFERLIWHNGNRMEQLANRKQPINTGVKHQKKIIKKIKPQKPKVIPVCPDCA